MEIKSMEKNLKNNCKDDIMYKERYFVFCKYYIGKSKAGYGLKDINSGDELRVTEDELEERCNNDEVINCYVTHSDITDRRQFRGKDTHYNSKLDIQIITRMKDIPRICLDKNLRTDRINENRKDRLEYSFENKERMLEIASHEIEYKIPKDKAIHWTKTTINKIAIKSGIIYMKNDKEGNSADERENTNTADKVLRLEIQCIENNSDTTYLKNNKNKSKYKPGIEIALMQQDTGDIITRFKTSKPYYNNLTTLVRRIMHKVDDYMGYNKDYYTDKDMYYNPKIKEQQE